MPAARRDAESLARHRNEQLQAAHQRLIQAVADLGSSEGWQRMLTLAARLPSYSLNNLLLIAVQRPDASHVAGYQAWRQLGRHVRKGERGIAILAPCLYQASDSDRGDRPVEAEEPAPAALDAQRTPSARVLHGFRVVHVFDIAQTDGPPLPDLAPEELRGPSPERLWDRLAAVVTTAGFQLERGPCAGAYGHTDYATRTVRVRADVDDAQAAKTLAHEVGHIRADHEHRYLATYHTEPSCRGAAEVEAESIAYLVTSLAGMDSHRYSVPYLAGWANGDPARLRDTADRVLAVASDITAATVPMTPTAAHTRGRGQTTSTARTPVPSTRQPAVAAMEPIQR